jgi:biopolymer transport protein ExbD
MQLDLTSGARRARISITPLIDVVFILLLFFMLSSSFMQWRQLDLPMPTAGSASDAPVVRIRLLNNAGAIEIGESRSRMGDTQWLKERVLDSSDAVFAVDVAEGVQMQAMIHLVDALKSAGATRVSLAGVLQ